MTLVLAVWFAAAVVGAAWVAYDLVANQPEIIPLIEAAWVTIALYLGVGWAVTISRIMKRSAEKPCELG